MRRFGLQPLDAERVREWRGRRMLSQQEVADRAGTSLFTIQRIERGEGNVRPKTGRGVAAALGIPIEELLPKVQAPLFRELPEQEPSEEWRVAINYGVLRDKLAEFCSYWQRILDAGELDLRSLEHFNAAAAVLSPTYLELWEAEKAELGPEKQADEPTFHSERSALWPAIEEFISLGIQMDRIARERFDRHGTAEVIDIFSKKAS
jgi:transcriptional regulator with XRE-family HTH domain